MTKAKEKDKNSENNIIFSTFKALCEYKISLQGWEYENEQLINMGYKDLEFNHTVLQNYIED